MVPQLLEGQPLAEGNQYSFTVKQPDLPTLDLPKVEELKAETNGEQVHVSWSIPKAASPQYQIKIEIFNFF